MLVLDNPPPYFAMKIFTLSDGGGGAGCKHARFPSQQILSRNSVQCDVNKVWA